MSLTHTPTHKVLKSSDRIARDTERFLSAGGEINEIPRGQSGHNLEIRTEKSSAHGTRRYYADPKMKINSDAAKAASIRKTAAKKENARLRKSQSNVGRPKKPRDERFQRAKNLLSEGKSQREVCRILDLSRGTLRNWLDTDEEVQNGQT